MRDPSPVFGSVKTAVGSTSPEAILGSHFSFCAAVPLPRINSAAISDRVPSEPTPIYPRDSSSETTHIDPCPVHSAEFFRNGEPKNAQFRHLFDYVERDVTVRPMPTLRVPNHLGIGEPAHFHTNRFQCFFEATNANGGAMTCTHQFDQPRSPFRSIAAGDQSFGDRT